MPARFVLTLLFGVVLCLAGCAGSRAPAQTDWLPDATGWEVREVDASVPPQWVLYERDSELAPVKEFRIVGIVDASPPAVAQAVRDKLLDPQYSPEGLQRDVLQNTESEIVLYGLMPLPFPFDDREATEATHFTHDSNTGVYRVDTREIKTEGEPGPGVLRIPLVRNTVVIAPLGSEQSLVTNDSLHDIGGNFPNWVVYGPVCDQLVEDLQIVEDLAVALEEEW